MYAPTTKGELARAYSPHLVSHAAINRLSRWMGSCQPLMKALHRTGYSNTQKKISGRQKQLIYKHLGRPKGCIGAA